MIGSAQFLLPPSPPNPGTTIVQHVSPGLDSVATAVIEYPGPPSGTEYITPDIRVEFAFGGASAVFAPEIYYDVQLYVHALPLLPADYQTILDTQVSAFVTLPPLTNPAAASLTLPTDGTPINFTALLNAVNAVLSSDPATPVTPAEIAALTLDQCRNIAYEIVYGPQVPLPQPPDTLENLYTDPPNSGTYSDPNEQNRLLFQGKLAGYYGLNDAAAVQLLNYVFALSAAVYGELQTQNTTSALVEFPVNPNVTPPPTLTTVTESEIIFTGALGIDVPAAYFYALTCQMPAQVSKDQRYQLAIGADEQQNFNTLQNAINQGWIDAALLNPVQAVRILQTLNVPPSSTATPWPLITSAAAGKIWLDYGSYTPAGGWQTYVAATDDLAFWTGPAGEADLQPGDFLQLVLFALTQGYNITPPGTFLATQIQLYFGLANVGQVAALTPSQWQTFFGDLPGFVGGGATADSVLPPFTQPGSVAARIAYFIIYVQQFFQMANDALPVFPPVTMDVAERYGVPAFDIIARTILAYPGFVFGPAVTLAGLEAAAATLPIDPQAQAWAVQAVWTINELFILAVLPPQPQSFEFSVMEALFARGFTTREEVLDLPFDDFLQALTGTVAYDFAAAIYANAGPPLPFPPPPPHGFEPINPCCLTDCIPPLYLSPLGPIEYLHELLKLSERSSCDRPFAPPAPGHTTLQAHIDARRGPVETLAVTAANLETPLPLIDMVNECLEFMASTSPITQHGAVYNTAEHVLAGHKLCVDECCGEEQHDEHHDCHKPVVLFDALPEYSTPATPVPEDSSVEPAVWDKLESDFSTCCLPYDQALDVSRTYIDHFRSCRYEEMRTFRKCITEFVLDPVHQPAQFQTYVWRYPVRIDIAIEYLGISREEYTTLFNGVWPHPCGHTEDRQQPAPHHSLPPWQLYGFASEHVAGVPWNDIVVRLPQFLKRTCLTYCEFIELWKCGPVKFRSGPCKEDRRDKDGRSENKRESEGDKKNPAKESAFPDCEPCCLDDLCLEFPEDRDKALWEIAVFIRLWRKLKHLCGAEYTFCQLADICSVLHFPSPHFIRQLAAFQMLRDQFRLKLTGGESHHGALGADRTWLLSLWVGPAAKHWHWALEHLIEGIAYHAKCRLACGRGERDREPERRGPEFLKLLASNFDALSRLAGFDPGSPADNWHAAPTHTLRFAEVLAKIYASNFSIGEILFLFTAEPHLDGEDPFPLQDEDEAEDQPLGLPEEEHRHSLWELRRKLLHVEVGHEDAQHWTWRRIESALTHEFGFDAPTVTAFGEHFFPQILEAQG